MSRIDDLIAEYCPNGVEFKRLGDVALYPKKRIAANEVVQNAYVGVESLLSNMQGRRPVTPVPNESSCIEFLPKDILLGNIRPYLKKIWLSDIAGGTNGDVIVLRLKEGLASCLMPDFLFEVLKGDSFFSFFIQHSRGGKMPRGDKKQVLTFRIPIPPLPVQEEIVRILDSFSSLEAELEAELEARRKQYTHYRDELLRFERERVLIASLGELCKISVGRKNGTAGEFGEYPYVNAGTSMSGFVNEWSEEGDCVTTPSRGQGGMGFVAYQASRFWCGPLCYVMRSKHSDVMIKYVYYYLCSHKADILGLVHEGGTPAINKSELAGLRILVPPFEEQQRIVSILNRFDKLTNDLSSGLPAEIEVRHKQYEYYRDRLLSFDELAV